MNLLRKIWNTKNYRISFVLAVLMLLWLASGLLNGQSGTDNQQASGDSASLMSVKAKILVAEELPLAVSIRARTEPIRSVDVKAEISGSVINLPVEKGEFVRTDSVICELALEDREELLLQSKAGLEKAQLDYDGALRLKTGGFQSQSEIAQALAGLETAKAAYKRAQLDLENLNVKSPFDGFVDARPVELGDLMQRGDICARVLDMDPLLITGRVSEADIANISVGDSVNGTLATGEVVTGVVRFVERTADEVTRTFRLEALVSNPDLNLLAGVSAQLNVPTTVVKAHLVNSSLLTLDDEGALGLKIVDAENRVHFVLADLVADHESGVWVSGLPETIKLITVGQQYATEGEEVLVTLEEAEDAASVVVQ